MAVFIADERTAADAAVEVDVDRVARLATHVLSDRGVPADMEVSVLFVDRVAIAKLNEHHMGKPGPTDVLAFPLDMPGESLPGEPAILGDVVVCASVAAEQAPAHGQAPQDEVDLLVVHGILHLLGHDHAEPAEREVMFGMTDRLLAEFRAEAES